MWVSVASKLWRQWRPKGNVLLGSCETFCVNLDLCIFVNLDLCVFVKFYLSQQMYSDPKDTHGHLQFLALCDNLSFKWLNVKLHRKGRCRLNLIECHHVLVWSGYRLGLLACYFCCQSSLQAAANLFFVLIFRFVFVYLCVVVYEATRAWRPVACMFAQLERKPQNLPSFKAAADIAKSSELTLFPSSKSPRRPTLTFLSSLHS